MKKRKNSGLGSRKANVVSEVLLIIVVVFVFGMIAMVGYKAWQEIEPDLRVETNDSAQAQDVIDMVDTRYPSVFDALGITVFILLWAMVIVASFLIDSHPIFFIFSAVLVVFVLIAGMYISNAYEEIFADDDLDSLPAEFPKTYWLLTHILESCIAVVATVAIALYAKKQMV